MPVNLRDLERVFDDGAEVTLEAMVEKGLIKNTRTDVKVLGEGELKKKLTVTAHLFSASAREKIEKAGGSATALRPPREEKKKRPRKKAAETPAEEPEAPEAAADEAPAEAEAAEEQQAARRPPRRPPSRCSPGSPTPGAFPSFAGACSSRR